MTRLEYLRDLYAISAGTRGSASSVDIFAVADDNGAALDRATRELARQVESATIPQLDDLLVASRRLRWRLPVEPVPRPLGQARGVLAVELQDLAARCRVLVGADSRWILDEIRRSAGLIAEEALPALAGFVVEWLRETGGPDSVVVAFGSRSAHALRSWFAQQDIQVLVINDRQYAELPIHRRALLVGAPSVFGPTVHSAPRTYSLSYALPSWIQDRTLPLPPIAAHMAGRTSSTVTIHKVGQEPYLPERLREAETRVEPEPIWRRANPRPTIGTDEVHARRVLLSGGLSMMLDLDGESIRALNPDRPAGRRVEMCEVSAVREGTHLVLREGQSESGPLYARAMTRLGERARSVEGTQAEWKTALRTRLQDSGAADVVRQLRSIGVVAAAQAPAWTAQTLARPNSDDDFNGLLRWLGLPGEPYRQNAEALRRARSQAVADVREALESALGESDMGLLLRDGLLRMNLDLEGFAGIVAARVLAVSPYLEVVTRSDLRVPEEDASAPWLE